MNRSELETALRRVIPSDSSIAVIHSSLVHLWGVQKVDKWGLLGIIQNLANEGLTLAFPAFTFSFCKGIPYHYLHSKSQVGILADWVGELSSACRSRHPVYSHWLIGPLAKRLASCEDSTPFGESSLFAEFERHDAQIAMLGCGWDYCTPFHRYEQLASVPYRYFKEFKGLADFGEGGQVSATSMFVRDLVLDCENDFSPVVARLKASGEIHSESFMAGTIESVKCSVLADACQGLLDQDPWSLVKGSRQKEFASQNLKSAAQKKPLKIALLGHSNLHFIAKELANEMSQVVLDQKVEIFTPPFGQFIQQTLHLDSDLVRFGADFTFFVDQVEDLFGLANLEMVDGATALAKINQFASSVISYAEKVGGWMFVLRPECQRRTTSGLATRADVHSASRLADGLAAELESLLAPVSQLHFLKLSAETANFEGGACFDPRLWFLGRFPFSESFSRHLAHRFTGLVLAASGRASRVLLVDLDNTLWGGVLGEDGLAGVKVGGDYPGNAFLEFQKVLKGLGRRGLALAIVSKNDEANALDALASLPGLHIRPEDLASHRINWKPKWQNAISICKELSLGLESALFIDDNPVEREQMRQNCPQVKILDLPADPAFYCKTLLDSLWVECIQVTAEDLNRTKSFQARKVAAAAQGEVKDMEAFQASLKPKLHLNPISAGNTQRTLQLINKTNQFNTTTRRYAQAQLVALEATGGKVIVIGAEDQFSALENIGVLILRWDRPDRQTCIVDTYLMSCRVLGRGLETGVLHWLKRYARNARFGTIRGEILETERNQPCRHVFRDAGFHAGDRAGQWCLNLQPFQDSVPDWLTIIDNVSGEESR